MIVDLKDLDHIAVDLEVDLVRTVVDLEDLDHIAADPVGPGKESQHQFRKLNRKIKKHEHILLVEVDRIGWEAVRKELAAVHMTDIDSVVAHHIQAAADIADSYSVEDIQVETVVVADLANEVECTVVEVMRPVSEESLALEDMVNMTVDQDMVVVLTRVEEECQDLAEVGDKVMVDQVSKQLADQMPISRIYSS